MKQEFYFNLNCMNANVDLMEVYLIQSINGIMMNACASVMN